MMVCYERLFFGECMRCCCSAAHGRCCQWRHMPANEQKPTCCTGMLQPATKKLLMTLVEAATRDINCYMRHYFCRDKIKQVLQPVHIGATTVKAKCYDR